MPIAGEASRKDGGADCHVMLDVGGLYRCSKETLLAAMRVGKKGDSVQPKHYKMAVNQLAETPDENEV